MSNQDSTQNVPALRLNGFEGVWIAQQLSEFLEKSTISNGDLAYSREHVYAVSLTEGLVNQIKFHGRSFAGKNLDNYDVVLHGDVVYTKSPLSDAPFGIVKCNSGEPGLVSPLYAVYHPKAGISPHFVQHYFALHSRLNDYLRPLVSKGAKNTMNITDDQALAGEVIFPPTLEEQQAISAIFTNLDSTLRSHRKKLDLLKQTKTSLLQRMFPQDGATVPELRLDGFEGEWEQQMLIDQVDFFSGLTYTPSDVVSDGGTLVLRSGNVQNGAIITDDCVYVRPSVVKVENVRENDIVMVVRNGSRSLIGKHALIKCDMPSTVVGAFMTGVRAKQPSFVSALFSTQRFDDEVAKSMGATINQITGRMFGNMSFLFPPSPEEQQAIGAVFSKLDTLIGAEAQFIDKLTQTKTALLQKMFA